MDVSLLNAGFFQGIADGFYNAVIAANRWEFFLAGLGRTLVIAAGACALGIVLGLILALFKISAAGLVPAKGALPLRTRIGRGGLRFLGWFANLYTTVIRGTPALLQLLIWYSVIFSTAPKSYQTAIAAFAFGINSGAYVCEIVRAGIQSVDRGQTEAGRSLGLSQSKTMRLIVIPQAIKNILPTLFNEFISLLKETSVAGYIGVVEITKAGDIVRSRTWNFYPLFVSALLYLALVYLLTQVQNYLERRLQASDQRL